MIRCAYATTFTLWSQKTCAATAQRCSHHAMHHAGDGKKAKGAFGTLPRTNKTKRRESLLRFDVTPQRSKIPHSFFILDPRAESVGSIVPLYVMYVW